MTNARLIVSGVLLVISSAFYLAPEAAQTQSNSPSPGPQAISLIGTKWNLIEAGGQRVPQDSLQPFFSLRAHERFEGGSSGYVDASADCGNVWTGNYRASGSHLQIRIGTHTLVACKVPAGSRPPPALAEIFRGTSGFRLHGAFLELTGENGVVARFAAADRN
jgi:heat shock protein HslJ